jgi:hypothetical protein
MNQTEMIYAVNPNEVFKKGLPAAECLTKDELTRIIPYLDELEEWTKSVKEYALTLVLQGEKLTGYKLVEGKSNRAIADTSKAAQVLIENGYDEAMLYEKKFATITNLEKLVGKAKLTALLGNLIVKPGGKPTLAPDSDRRPAMNIIVNAKDDFEDTDDGL